MLMLKKPVFSNAELKNSWCIKNWIGLIKYAFIVNRKFCQNNSSRICPIAALSSKNRNKNWWDILDAAKAHEILPSCWPEKLLV